MQHSCSPRQLLALLAILFGSTSHAAGSDLAGPAVPEPSPEDNLARTEPSAPASRDWSLQAGVGIISNGDIHEILSGEFERAVGDAGGELYSLTLNWTARRFELSRDDGRVLEPLFEPYLTVTFVDQNNRHVFPDYNGGVGVRWVDFPWNSFLKTTFFMGLGLSYSRHVYVVDRARHEGESRSHLKFDWPIQFTFALPSRPQHQLVLFNDHQSGGHVFDEGGANSVGLGYRYEF